jgi:hypothetical protein
MNFKVSVGTIVWNQHKHILTNDNKKTRLIYSSDINNNNLINVKYKNEEKKNYIDKDGFNDLLLDFLHQHSFKLREDAINLLSYKESKYIYLVK